MRIYRKVYEDIKKNYAPNTTMQIVILKKEFGNCKPKSGKSDPDVWFNELESHKMRLTAMSSTITNDDMLAHLLLNVTKEYEGVVMNTQTTMHLHQTLVTVNDFKGVIKDCYKYMKDQGILKKDPEEAFFAKEFKGTCNKCCLLYTSPSPRDGLLSRMPSSA